MIKAAKNRIGSNSNYTPLLSSKFLDKISGKKIYVKAECLQKTGSFKFRGGWSFLSNLTEKERRSGVLAFSSGNHAQGVSAAAKAFSVPCTIVMPKDAPKIKIKNTVGYGAQVVLYDRKKEVREDIGYEIAKKNNLKVIHPYEEPLVIAGQGTAGLEIADQAKELSISHADVLVCCGGGGLTSGIALALSELCPHFKVRPVEPEYFDDTVKSLEQGRIIPNSRTTGSICDAILTPQPGKNTFKIIKSLCHRGLAVNDEQVLKAIALAFLHLKIILEPGGAVALAAALFLPHKISSETLIVVGTGGNIDSHLFKRALDTLDVG